MANFHEDFRASEIAPPPERSTGLVLAAAAGLIAAIWYRSPALWLPFAVVATALALLSLLAPALLKPITLLWFRFSMLVHRVTNPVVMMLMYVIAIVPAGLIMQLLRDPLKAKRNPARTTYWLDKTEEPGSMKNQF